MTLEKFVRDRIETLIDSVAEVSLRAEKEPSDDGVHDLRVAIRRLSENLRVFEDLFPDGAAKAVRKELREAMELAGRARNHDIALNLMKKAELEIPEEIGAGRTKAELKLASVLERWNSAKAADQWREQLHA